MASPILNAHLRVARPTDNIERLRNFYCDGLGFSVLGSFQDHEGFDGLMLGLEGMGYHLEFTRKQGHDVGRAPTEEHLIVFYLSDTGMWDAAVARMQEAGFASVKAFNPYWDVRGKTFEDADGYRVVLQNAAWTNKIQAKQSGCSQ